MNAEPIDTDPSETAEWRDAYTALVQTQGPARARWMLDELARLVFPLLPIHHF